MITLTGLTKRYRSTTAVDDLTVDVAAGRVTGFLGPNGAGKSTTMRMILGLDRPTSGRALIDGQAYRDLRDPLRQVGALLDARAVNARRSARHHLLALAHGGRIDRRRVEVVLDRVGLTPVADRRVGTYSLGMEQRLGVATALIGDPPVLLLDEPVNGLDPEGVRWIRELLRSLADEGRTVLVSSHLMSEMQLTADHVIVLGRGRLLADTPITELIGGAPSAAVEVRSPRARELAERLSAAGFTVRAGADPEQLLVVGANAAQIGELAFAERLPLHGLSAGTTSLETAYLSLTAGSIEYSETTGPVR